MQFALQLSTASLGCPAAAPGCPRPRAGVGNGPALSEPKGTYKYCSSSTGPPSLLRNRHYLCTKSPQCLKPGHNRDFCPQPWLKAA